MILYLHFGDPQPEPVYRRLLDMVGEFTPVAQALPPDAALADVSGSTRYFDRDAAGLAGLIRMRAAALHGLDVTVGIGPNPLLARLAAHRGEPGPSARSRTTPRPSPGSSPGSPLPRCPGSARPPPAPWPRTACAPPTGSRPPRCSPSSGSWARPPGANCATARRASTPAASPPAPRPARSRPNTASPRTSPTPPAGRPP
ncbi:Y-family DNA polymerase [Streptomyces sp. b62]|uniref:Y-family DNA polymerase n=1 Tax=Streptomyces sp. b62 TaxID=1827627 RepID=UPI0027B8C626|nr:hypothetical protein [Streptomyces sp. b62]